MLIDIKPTGYYVLVEAVPVPEQFEGSSILMPSHTHTREQGGRDIGHVRAFGPLAFRGFEKGDGKHCRSPDDWGVAVGDLVEFNRYDGKVPRMAENHESMKNLRIINDSDILAVVTVTEDDSNG
jgi:co-chaperonin GroES (HSP10)